MDSIEKYLKKIAKDKDRQFNDLAYNDNLELLLENLVSMYEVTGEPETCNMNFFFLYAICEGFAAVYKFPSGYESAGVPAGSIIAARVQLTGHPDANGLGKDAIVSTDSGFSLLISDYKNNPNIEVFNINRLYLPDISVWKSAYFLTETEKSMRAVLRLARYSKVLEVKDEKTKEQLTAALKAVDNGNIATFVSERAENLLAPSEGEEGTKDISLTDVRNNDILQYLSKFKSDLMRDFFNRYGMSTDGSEKMAQQTEAETNKGGFKSLILPISRLTLLKEFFERVNKKLGLNIAVDFSEPWRLEFSRLLHEENVVNQSEEEAEDQSEEETEDQTENQSEEETEDQTEEETEDQTEEETEDQTEEEKKEGADNG